MQLKKKKKETLNQRFDTNPLQEDSDKHGKVHGGWEGHKTDAWAGHSHRIPESHWQCPERQRAANVFTTNTQLWDCLLNREPVFIPMTISENTLHWWSESPRNTKCSVPFNKTSRACSGFYEGGQEWSPFRHFSLTCQVWLSLGVRHMEQPIQV